MAIKASLGRLRLPTTAAGPHERKVGQGYRVLPVSGVHAASVESLPWHHCDPFDRLLAAQVLAEGSPLVTRDRIFRKHGIDVIW